MAGVDEEYAGSLSSMTPEEIEFDEQFLKDKYPLDPLMLALPLLELKNLHIDAQLAFELQEAYEDLANRYLDISALLRTYAAQERSKAFKAQQSAESAPEVRNPGSA